MIAIGHFPRYSPWPQCGERFFVVVVFVVDVTVVVIIVVVFVVVVVVVVVIVVVAVELVPLGRHGGRPQLSAGEE